MGLLFLRLTITLGILYGWAWILAVSVPAPIVYKTWHISGRVWSLQGEPLSDVTVKLETEDPVQGQRTMGTNLQGEFKTEISVDMSRITHLQGELVARKTGYAEGREKLDLYLDSAASGIDIILCKTDEDEGHLPITRLVSILAPKLKSSAAKTCADEAGQPEFIRGFRELTERQNPYEAILLFEKSANRTPECIECQLLLELALLRAGKWGSAVKQLRDASFICDLFGSKRTELDLIAGIVEARQGHAKEAIGFFTSVLEADPENVLALQELGRIALAQKNWEVAEQLLSRSLRTEVSEDALLLHAHALLELGKANDAYDEIIRYAAGREIKDLPQTARILHSKVQNRISLLSRGQVTSVNTHSMEELLKALPDLQGLEPAADQSQLEELLNKTGKGVDAFLQDFPNTASLEKIRQERLNKDGEAETFLDQEFRYIMLAQNRDPSLGVREYRSTEDGQDAVRGGLKEGLMLTSGFASVSSIFHPVNRRGADFRYLGTQKTDNREMHVIAFSQKPETAKILTRFVTNNRSTLALVHGVAWVNAETFQILRLHTFLLRPLPEVQLLKLSTDIKFQEVAFRDVSEPLWLPREVEIVVSYRGRDLRNKHSYSDFKLFSVESREERGPVHSPPTSLAPEFRE